ncbi:MAG: hypothetical protein JW797_15305 [Bradymonadales bacterium]|nr:hypothetical protein [Bradymonadales bacterium]
MLKMYHGAMCLVLLALLAACGPTAQPTYVRGDDVPWLDDPAMSVGLDLRDLEQLLEENMASLQASAWWQTVSGPSGTLPSVAVMPMENRTTEHVDSQLHALIGMVETQLVNSNRFTVIAAELRDQIIEELRLQQGAEFDQSRAVQLGGQLGVHYFITGRVVDNSERTAEYRRVQYYMFMQAISVETGAIAWQNQSELTKGIVPMVVE